MAFVTLTIIEHVLGYSAVDESAPGNGKDPYSAVDDSAPGNGKDP
jgi:hypothetical protein